MPHESIDSWSRGRIYAAAAAGIAIIVGTSIWYAVYHAQQSEFAGTTAVASDAAAATTAGNYDTAYDLLKNSESKATTTAQRVVLYGELAAAAANIGKLNESIMYYTARHNLDPETKLQDAELLADVYERADKIPQAIAQYQLARQYVLAQPQSASRDAHVQTIDAIIKNLESTP
jgi:tetratricopeptide (TPR) repeat protein